MLRASSTSANDIKIARAGDSTKVVPFVEGNTVEYYLREAGVTLSSSEEVYVESVSAAMTDIIEANDLVQIVGKKDGGR